MKSNIFLTGFSGTGKTTVGREVASRLGWRFVDVDEEIVGTTGRSITDIFEREGESRFRDLEHERLASVCGGEEQVVATGGGVVSSERNRRLMEESGVVVCLDARPETVHSRLLKEGEGIGGEAVRPMLNGGDRMARIVALKSERQPSYALAHWTVHTDNMTPSEAAAEVIRAWVVISGCSKA